ncbi:MAG: hypothetical protein FWE34_01460 [Defluviitaleaceae bacterium]|nr:hypothetical protein [Defluviitaleaceae bacterium]
MDTGSSLVEFHRVLKPDGVLAIYDFALPPIFDWEIEKAFVELRDKCSKIYYAQENPPKHNNKNTCADKIKAFSKFRHVREVSCHGLEAWEAQKLMDFVLSTSNAPYATEFDTTIKKDTKYNDNCYKINVFRQEAEL